MLTSLFLFVFHRWETIDCTQKSAIKYTYKVQSQEIFCFGLCVLAKTAYGFPLLQSLEHLRYECQVVVFIRLRDVLEIAKRGLDHVAQQEVQELGCVTLFAQHEEATSPDVLEKQRDAEGPHLHVAFLLVLHDLFDVTFDYAEGAELGV